MTGGFIYIADVYEVSHCEELYEQKSTELNLDVRRTTHPITCPKASSVE
jgi:hypothetical protein